MVSCSDDVRHMTDESSARIHRGRRAVRRGPIRTNLRPPLQGNPPTVTVREYLHPDRFAHWKTVADQLGFLYTASGPLVRSSYRADEFYIENIIRKQTQRANSVTVSASPHDATTRIV
ncbi:unnamed protein product [Protopolystoma xenopodis]|uniref:Uncharacterized protein n=1 Tax=Protopolystoma xenopodis TaxID=117903 RepID=A0A3S5CT28_9PLAT|nr:unnamed protein product [Protopolystoma xenopodis]